MLNIEAPITCDYRKREIEDTADVSGRKSMPIGEDESVSTRKERARCENVVRVGKEVSSHKLRHIIWEGSLNCNKLR